MTSAQRFAGGCLRGGIRFVVEGPPYRVGICHCLDCRKHGGAPFGAFAIFPAATVTFSGDEPGVYASSAHGRSPHQSAMARLVPQQRMGLDACVGPHGLALLVDDAPAPLDSIEGSLRWGPGRSRSQRRTMLGIGGSHGSRRFRDIQWIDLWQEKSLDHLANSIGHALGVATTPPTFPEEGLTTIPPPEPMAERRAGQESGERANPAAAKLLVGREGAPGTVLRDVDAPWCPELVVVPSGKFMMGSARKEKGRYGDEGPQHEVSLAYSFAVGRYPITGRKPRPQPWSDGNCHIPFKNPPPRASAKLSYASNVTVSWEEAKRYVEWLSSETGNPYRLLAEAEWEYACRAGTTTRYSQGDDEPTVERANFGGHVGKTSEVGSYPPNPWGLCDMHGNVWEWCEDCWNDNYKGAPTDGIAWTSGDCSRRVLRGGSWVSDPGDLRSACRNGLLADDRGDFIGFRVARTLR